MPGSLTEKRALTSGRWDAYIFLDGYSVSASLFSFLARLKWFNYLPW
jgi:hypothetical protein